VVENGKLLGMKFERLEWNADATKSTLIDEVFIPADAVILAIGQEGAFSWIERDIGIEFDKWGMAKVDKKTFQSTREGVFFGGDAAWGPENIIWAVAHGHQAAISIHNYCQGVPLTERPEQGMTLASTKMGLHEWAYSNDYSSVKRQKMTHVGPRAALQAARHRGGARLHGGADGAGGGALPQLRRADRVLRAALHRVRRVRRHLPGPLPHHHARTAKRASSASA
jgi:hypothetical protein